MAKERIRAAVRRGAAPLGLMFQMGARHPDFRRLWVASVLSETGSALSMVALPLYVIAVSHSYALAGLLTTVGLLGTLIMRIPGGFVADRWERRRLMQGAAAVGAVAMGAVAACTAWHPSGEWAIIGVAWSVNLWVAAAVAPVQSAAVRRTLPDAEVQTGLAAWQAQYAAVMLVGPLLGGLVFEWAHALPFAVDAASFLGELLVLVRIRASLGGGQAAARGPMRCFAGLLSLCRAGSCGCFR